MTFLFFHIVLSILALVGTSTLLIRSWRNKQAQNSVLLKTASLVTAGSVLTGSILILQGASVARVCLEGGVVVILNAGLLIYSRKLVLAKAIGQ